MYIVTEGMTNPEANDTVFFAAYRLPIAVAADGEVLGLTIRGRFGGAVVEVHVPVRQADDVELDTDDLSVTMARTNDEPVPHATGQVLRDWTEPPACHEGRSRFVASYCASEVRTGSWGRPALASARGFLND